MNFMNFINSFCFYKTTTEPPAASIAAIADLENAFAVISSLALIEPSPKNFQQFILIEQSGCNQNIPDRFSPDYLFQLKPATCLH